MRRRAAEELRNKVGTTYPVKRFGDIAPVLRVVPEEEHPLQLLVVGCGGGVNFLSRVGMYAGVVYLRGERHRRGGEILYLLKMEVQSLGGDSELCHVFFGAAGMRRDKVGYQLLAQTGTSVLTFEEAVEFAEEFERRLAHEPQNGIGRMLRSHF